jgi:hypothetical protein
VSTHLFFPLLFVGIVVYFVIGAFVGVAIEKRHGPPPDEQIRRITVAAWPLVLMYFAWLGFQERRSRA